MQKETFMDWSFQISHMYQIQQNDPQSDKTFYCHISQGPWGKTF